MNNHTCVNLWKRDIEIVRSCAVKSPMPMFKDTCRTASLRDAKCCACNDRGCSPNLQRVSRQRCTPGWP